MFEDNEKYIEEEEIINELLEFMGFDKKWYFFCVISGKECKIKECIEFEIDCLKWVDFIMQVLVLIEKVYKICVGKKVIFEWNIFFGYILIEVIFVRLFGEII